jgi:peptide/nickel transport system substrate-binding protein
MLGLQAAARAAAALTVLATAGAAAVAGAHGASAAGGVLRMNVSNSDVASVDPALGSDNLSGQVVLATCARLVGYPDRNGAAGGRIVPDAATGLPRVSSGGRVYTFTVRKGWRFSDGSPLTAASFRRAYERALTPAMRAYAANFLQDIVGARAMLAGKAKHLAGVTAHGSTLSVRLAAPAPDFLARATLPALCAVRADSPAAAQGMNTPAAAGPYYVSARVPNRSVTLKRNPYYRGARPHHLDEIDITTNTAQQASYLQLQKGDADYDPNGVPATAGATLARRYGVNRSRYFVTPFLETDYLALNTKRPAFSDASVRRAVNFALDRQAIATQIGVGAAAPTDQILPPGIPGFRDAHIYPLGKPELAKAKALMAGRQLTAKLFITTDPAAQNEAQVIKANLAAIGIDVSVKALTFSALINVVGHTDAAYDMVLIGWAADYADPDDFINVTLAARNITPSNNLNLPQFDDPVFQKRMDADARLFGAARSRAYAALDRDVMAQAAPWAPIANRVSREFVSSRVGCYVAQSVFPQLDLAAACLKGA